MSENDETTSRGSRGSQEEEERALLARLRNTYLENAGQKAEDTAVLLCRVIAARAEGRSEAEASEEGPLEQAMRLAHSLAGSGASYGLPGITARAREIEDALRETLQSGNGETSALIEPLAKTMELRRLILLAREGGMELF